MNIDCSNDIYKQYSSFAMEHDLQGLKTSV